jgi:hypothetical protein
MKTLYFHSDNKSQKRVTVAGVVVDNTLRIGVSICAPKDMFTKKKGRLISEGRASKRGSETKIIPLNADSNPGKLFVEEAKTICSNLTSKVKGE